MESGEIAGLSIPEDDLVKLKAIFEEIDVDKTGSISRDHMRTCAQVLGQNPTRFEIENAINSVNVVTPGQLSFEECRHVVEAICKSREAIENEISKYLSQIIQSLESTDGDVFSKEELKSFLQERGDEPLLQEQMDAIFNDLDPDGNSDTFSLSQLIQLLTTEF